MKTVIGLSHGRIWHIAVLREHDGRLEQAGWLAGFAFEEDARTYARLAAKANGAEVLEIPLHEGPLN